MSEIRKVFIGVETVEDYPPRYIPRATVGISKYSIEELIEIMGKYFDRNFIYRKLIDVNDIPTENNGKFYYDIAFVYRYIVHASDSFEIWIANREAPLLINHLEQDLRILISPIRGSE